MPGAFPARRVLVLQHIACEPPGVYGEVMRERGARLHTLELDEGDPLPDRPDADAIVVMGGPMGAYEDERHPWLTDEKAFLRDAVEAGIPVFGACLGAQLLAEALGGRAFAGEAPEVGVLEVELTAEGRRDPVTGGLPPRFATLQWHGDTYELPPGGVSLASSPTYAEQAFRIGPGAYGVQFHLEVTEAMAAEWARVPAYAEALEAVRGPGALEDLLAEFASARAGMQRHARRLFTSWWDLREQLKTRRGISVA